MTEPNAPVVGLVSGADRRRGGVRRAFTSLQAAIMLGVLVAGLGPILWTLKGAFSSPQELITDPLRPWPSAPEWGAMTYAWENLRVGHYLLNTLVLVGGSCLVQIAVATTGAYALSVLRPRIGPLIYAAVLATLFVPSSVTLVAQYMIILDLPLTGGLSIANTPWAVWLPAGANAFNVLIMKRFFDGIPRELFEAASVDGAGAWRMFWAILLPMSKPIIAVLALLAVIAAWKDFLWPMVAISDTDAQPLAVALPRLALQAQQNVLLAGLFIALVPPVLIFIVFQRYIVQGVGFTGLKG